jgi:nitrous-oxide reductase
MKPSFVLALASLSIGGAAAFLACENKQDGKTVTTTGAPGGDSVVDLMKARNLTEKDVSAALKTYTPTGKKDEYYMFASGGHSGQIITIGLPSMRILKYIGVFTPEPWQGYAYGDQTNQVLAGGDRKGHKITWGDVHHPALSETKGDYDGQYLFAGDKANSRIAVIDLKNFTTVQVVTSELIESDHGGCFVTPNTDYVIESSQYASPLGGKYAPIEKYNDEYRGAVIFWKFDRAKGRIVPAQSFAIELPPYMQDLSDAGKLVSDGYAFINSFNTERGTGGNMDGKPPLESSSTKNDMDYLHVINWRKAEEVFKAGKTKTIAGTSVIALQTAIDEGILHFVPEPKSPHGVDVSPDGQDIVVGGKLDTHATVYTIDKIKKLIEEKKFEGRDPYGVPILPFKEAIRGQCEIGLGPLHTQFDASGNAYTSIFLESAVAKWSLKELKVIEKIPAHFNIGHLAAAEGDTVSPDGKFLVAMDKWSLDRFASVGPLLPQNFQLIDLTGAKMQLLYDMPIPLGEPHYAQIIKADKLKVDDIYKPVGFDPAAGAKDPFTVEGGKERVERKPDGVHVYMTAIRSHFTPDTVKVKEGDTVHFHITNLEQAKDATHGFTIDSFNVSASLEPGKHSNVTIKADKPGVYPMYCTEFCSALHLEMAGYFLVEPKEAK